MEIAKALILTGDETTGRPWVAGGAGPRHLFPVANRPILHHNLEALRAGGVLEAAILVPEDATAAAVETAVGDGRALGLSVRYERWRPEAGVRGALAAGQDFICDEPVLVQRGDTLLRERLHGHIATFAREQLDAMALRLAHGRPFGAPPRPTHLLSARGVSFLLDDAADAVSAIDRIEARGGRVRIQDVEGVLPCDGDEDALLASNRAMLERLDAPQPEVAGSLVQGAVEIHPTATVTRSTLRGPCVIGPGARIVDAYVGPYTSIGAGVVVEAAEIEHSIVLPDAELRLVGTRLESCIIGRGARVTRTLQPPAAMRLRIGDDAEIILG